MTREIKLSLILGFAAVLAVAVLLSDHLAGGSRDSTAGVSPLGRAHRVEPVEAVEEPPTLILVDEFGRPEPNQPPRPVPATPQNPRPRAVQPAAVADAAPTGGGEATLLDRLQQRFAAGVGEAMESIASGNGPPPSVILTDNSLSPPPLTETPTVSPGGSPGRGQAEGEFVLYNVKEGDTLWSIASRHLGDGKRFKEIADLNRDRMGKDGVLRAGASIRLPARVGHSGAMAPTAKASTPGRQPATYTVKPGDTLGKIASRLLGSSARYEDILLANRDTLKDEDTLDVGMVLAIPGR